MNRHWHRYALLLAVAVAGLYWAGVPASTLLIVLVVLACPAMMLLMHRSYGRSATRGERHDHPHDLER